MYNSLLTFPLLAVAKRRKWNEIQGTILGRTVCMNRRGTKRRLTYLVDKNGNRWFMIEKIDHKGQRKGRAYEPATMSLQERAGQLI